MALQFYTIWSKIFNVSLNLFRGIINRLVVNLDWVMLKRLPCVNPWILIQRFRYFKLILASNFIFEGTILIIWRRLFCRFLPMLMPKSGDGKTTGPDLSTLRTFRVLRPLKLVSGVPSKFRFSEFLKRLNCLMAFKYWSTQCLVYRFKCKFFKNLPS